VNLVILIASALVSLAAAANVGSPQPPVAGTSAGVRAPVPTPSPSPAPPVRYDVLPGGGPT
jgi:hypothetical protein